ncbi:hypothetical protein OPQ81_007501 [Rhizoctonia solani]|nr:hypothetical protein OPQ81_007501 [Rhizoctonia solani]
MPQLRSTRSFRSMAPRFRTINISMEDERQIEEFISTLLERHTPGSLSELSIRFTQMRDRIDRPPLAFDYILTHDPSQQELFAGLVRDLVAFRINNVLLRWDTLTFSTRLVELRIQQVTLGYDDAIIPFLRALSSASNLRDLEIVSVSTIYNPVTHIQPLSPPIKLPALRFLFMKDLYLNTLERLLSAIAPGPYRSTLFLSLGNLDINFLDGEPPDDEPEEFEETSYLCKILKHTEIDTLMISGLLDGGWLTDSELVNILKAVPTLKTLKLDTWIFGDELCNDLTRTKNARAPGGDRPLPALQNLHLTAVDIRSRKFFKDMVSSYPLKRFILGGQVLIDGVSGWKPLQEDSTVVQWLRSNMLDLDLRLVEKDYRPPEFHSSGWKLW